MRHHEEIVEYFKTRGVSAIFLFRRNLLRRMISILANSYDRDVKPLNGTHKSHVHSPREVTLSLSAPPSQSFCMCAILQQLMVSGRDTSEIQVFDQYNFADTQSEASRRHNCQSLRVL
jgi:hypothetical protein